ncbi:MAG: tetratricopeptide repeat protein [Planctomycetes bacterium]|nr:tetratricopeptide repeat protein [Planctomycetota bacterium]
MIRNRYRMAIIWLILCVLCVFVVNHGLADDTPETIFAEAEKLFEAQDYDGALKLYNQLLDKKYATTKFVTSNKDDITAKIKFCQKKVGVVTDITSILNGKAELKKFGKDDYLTVTYDFSKDDQLKDFTTDEIELSILDGKLQMIAKYGQASRGAAWLNNITFMDKVSVRFKAKITSDTSEEFGIFLLGGFRRDGYGYFFNYNTGGLGLVKGAGTASNFISFTTGKVIPDRMVATIGNFSKPKIEPNKQYDFYITYNKGKHQVCVDNVVQKEANNNKVTSGGFGLNCAKATILIDDLKIEGVLEPQSTRKTLVGLTAEKTADLQEKSDEETALRIRESEANISNRDILAFKRSEELLDQGSAAAKELVQEGLELLLEIPVEAIVDIDSLFKHIQKGIDKFGEAVQIDRKSAVGYYCRSRCYRLMGDIEKALAEVARAVEVDPTFYEGFCEMGELNMFQGQYENALKGFNQAIAAKDDCAEAYAGRGYVSFATGNKAEALDDLEKAVKLDPTDEKATKYLNNVKHVINGPMWQKTYTKETRFFTLKTDISQQKCDFYSAHLETIIKQIVRTLGLKEQPLLNSNVEVLIFDSKKGYQTYAGLTTGSKVESTLGYYHPIYRQLLLYEPPGREQDTLRVMYHEGFHMVIDNFSRNLSIWLEEGLAEYFGGATVKLDGGVQVSFGEIQKEQMSNLWNALEYDRTYSFRQIMNETKQQFYNQGESFKYVQAWSMNHFFLHYRNGQYAKNLSDYFYTLVSGKSAKEAFDKGFGKADLAKMEKEWRDYTLKLRPK